jgi:hypothetical protein
MARWPDAIAAWSTFTKLSPPRWCTTVAEERAEGLDSSFAMIRLVDHAVVISLRQVRERGLEDYATEILAHEIGHHVYTPADLRDNARLAVRIRAALPSREAYAGMVANLYTDLLINDRLQRSAGLDLAGVYKKIRVEEPDAIWSLYMRIYEVLWSLEAGELAPAELDDALRGDAALGARVIRAYGKDWLDGAGRFASLLLPYLLEIEPGESPTLAPWMDAQSAGAGGQIPDGLTAVEEGERGGAVHPADDDALTGLRGDGDDEDDGEGAESGPEAGGRAAEGGRKNHYRSPAGYTEVMRSLGVEASVEDLVVRYYRERAIPHLARFPTRRSEAQTEPLPEGLDTWDVGSPIVAIDWMETVLQSPYVIPGVTTVERSYGTTEGSEPERRPVDLYLGVDCSGSMTNPRRALSYPVLAGAVIVVSAFRVGARVKVTLSGEPGEHTSTPGFVRAERAALGVLTDYLGTGYAFGIERLRDTFLDGEEDVGLRPTHILVVTDADIFAMLERHEDGWEIARRAVERAGGGATLVLDRVQESRYADELARLRELDWRIHHVGSKSELVDFARAFSREKYEFS